MLAVRYQVNATCPLFFHRISFLLHLIHPACRAKSDDLNKNIQSYHTPKKRPKAQIMISSLYAANLDSCANWNAWTLKRKNEYKSNNFSFQGASTKYSSLSHLDLWQVLSFHIHSAKNLTFGFSVGMWTLHWSTPWFLASKFEEDSPRLRPLFFWLYPCSWNLVWKMAMTLPVWSVCEEESKSGEKLCGCKQELWVLPCQRHVAVYVSKANIDQSKFASISKVS